jgi:hypothetical protein
MVEKTKKVSVPKKMRDKYNELSYDYNLPEVSSKTTKAEFRKHLKVLKASIRRAIRNQLNDSGDYDPEDFKYLLRLRRHNVKLLMNMEKKLKSK